MMTDYETIIRNLEETWVSPAASGTYYAKFITEISGIPIFGCVDIETHTRGIFFRYPDNGKSYYFPAESRGFSITHKRKTGTGGNNTDLVISVTSKDFNDVFTTFIEDLLKLITVREPEGDLIDYVIKHLRNWQKFMEKISDRELSPKERRGLYGELYFLYNVLYPKIGIRNAILSWVGPDKAPQDFICDEKIAVEVKTTSAKSPISICISSEKQLDPTGFSNLFLCHIAVSEMKAKSDTLIDIIDKIRCAISDDVELNFIFSQKLLAARYREKDREKYLDKAHAVVRETYYLVSDDFPNIRVCDLKNGIGDVRYSIQEGVLEPFKTDKSLIVEQISRFNQ